MKLLSIHSFKNSLLAVQGLGLSAFIAVTQVQSLVRELRSCNLSGGEGRRGDYWALHLEGTVAGTQDIGVNTTISILKEHQRVPLKTLNE